MMNDDVRKRAEHVARHIADVFAQGRAECEECEVEYHDALKDMSVSVLLSWRAFADAIELRCKRPGR